MYFSACSLFQIFPKLCDEYSLIQRLVEFKVILPFNVVFTSIRMFQNRAEINRLSSFIFRIFFCFQKVRPSYHLINCASSKFCHIFTEFLRYKFHEMNHIFRFPFKTFPKFRILSRHSHRTAVLIADSHHHTSQCHKRCCGKPEFFCSKKRCNRHISSTHQLSVCLYFYSVSQTIFHQCLVCLCKSKFPRQPCIMNGAARSCTCTSIVSGNQYDLRSCLCDTGCDRPHTCF